MRTAADPDAARDAEAARPRGDLGPARNELATVITGNSANNVISGGLGADTLSGGGRNDVYQYRFTTESTAASMDQISGFNAGDKVNLSVIDAISASTANNDAFTFIGANVFSNTAGELRATETGGVWTIEADVNGDGVADLVIGLTTESGYLIGASDFVL